MTTHQTDIAGFWHSMDATRYKYADFSYPYDYGRLRIYSVKPDRGLVWYGFVKAYQFECWVIISLSIPLCGIIVYLLYKYGREDYRMPLWNCLWDISRIILWDSIPLKNRPGKVCIILATYSLGSFMVISYYLGEITSFITAKPYLWQPMNSFSQLKSSSMKYVVRKGFFEENLFLDDIIMK